MAIPRILLATVVVLWVSGVAFKTPWPTVLGLVLYARTLATSQCVETHGSRTLPVRVARAFLYAALTCYALILSGGPFILSAIGLMAGIAGVTLLGILRFLDWRQQRRKLQDWQIQNQEASEQLERNFRETIRHPRQIIVHSGTATVISLDAAAIRFWIENHMVSEVTERCSLNVTAMDVLQKSDQLVLALDTNIIEWRSLTEFKCLHQLNLGERPANLGVISLSPDERYLVVGDVCEEIVSIDLRTNEKVSHTSSSEFTSALAFSPDGSRLLVGLNWQGGAAIRLFRFQAGRFTPIEDNLATPWTLAGPTSFRFRFSKCGKLLAVLVDRPERTWSSEAAETLMMYDTRNWSLLWHVDLDENVTGYQRSTIAFSIQPTSDLGFLGDNAIVCGSDQGGLLVFNVCDGTLRKRHQLPISHRITTFAIDHEQRQLWTAAGEKLLEIPFDEILKGVQTPSQTGS
ncbi:MAG: WD40 repeat domain-containing protein [Planctomycetaceae bacterium]|nr:WD40 repeat domain-containing protein [Planctomycetaceae bacterium]